MICTRTLQWEVLQPQLGRADWNLKPDDDRSWLFMTKLFTVKSNTSRVFEWDLITEYLCREVVRAGVGGWWRRRLLEIACACRRRGLTLMVWLYTRSQHQQRSERTELTERRCPGSWQSNLPGRRAERSSYVAVDEVGWGTGCVARQVPGGVKPRPVIAHTLHTTHTSRRGKTQERSSVTQSGFSTLSTHIFYSGDVIYTWH